MPAYLSANEISATQKAMTFNRFLELFARLAGLISGLILLSLFIVERMPAIGQGKIKEMIVFLPYCLPAIIGFIIAWYKPTIGGVIMNLSALILAALFVELHELNTAAIAGTPILLIGICFILSGRKK